MIQDGWMIDLVLYWISIDEINMKWKISIHTSMQYIALKAIKSHEMHIWLYACYVGKLNMNACTYDLWVCASCDLFSIMNTTYV